MSPICGENHEDGPIWNTMTYRFRFLDISVNQQYLRLFCARHSCRWKEVQRTTLISKCLSSIQGDKYLKS